MKTCRRCYLDKPIEQFYKHKQMFDGHLNFCIECVKKRVSIHAKTPQGKLIDKKRNQSEKRKQWLREFQKKERAKFPLKNRARGILNNHTRNGRILKEKCKICGKLKVEAHHPDYSKPLEVIWLCIYHHKKLHGVMD